MDKTSFTNLGTYDNVQKVTTGQGDDYITSCLLDNNYFNKYFKMIAIDLSKQQGLDADPKTVQQINFARNQARNPNANTTIFFIIEEAKKPF